MSTEETVKQILAGLGIEVPEERVAPLAKAYEATLAQSASIRPDTTTAPAPSPFDPSWETK